MSLDIGRVAARVLLTYLTLLVLLRLGGKRTVDHATPFDFLFSLIIGDLLDDMLWMEVSYMKGLVAAGTLASLHILDQLIAYISPTADRWLNGRPMPLLVDGHLQPRFMTQERVDEAEIEGLLRTQAQLSLDEARQEVERAQLESNGEMSVRRHHDARPADKTDLPRVTEMLS